MAKLRFRIKPFLIVLLVFFLFLALGYDETEENAAEQGSLAADTTPQASEPTLLISLDTQPAVLNDEAVGDHLLGSGSEGVSGEGSFDPDAEIRISRSLSLTEAAKKRDVYNRPLSDDFFFYRNSLSRNERALYDQIYANARSGNATFDVNLPVHVDRVGPIYHMVRIENPELFWMHNAFNYRYDGNGNVTSLTIKYYDCLNNIDAFRQNFDNCADSILETVMYFERDIDKVKYIHDLLTNINAYEWADMNQSAYSALCNGKTVCAGYAFAFQHLMQRLGIRSAVVWGQAGGNHYWNLVELDNEFYCMDITWDDPIGNLPYNYRYNYFNITDQQISASHSRDPILCGPLPAAQGTTYSYNNYYAHAPGSDFSLVNYGKPRQTLPSIYDAEPFYGTTIAPPTEENTLFLAEDIDDWTDEDWDVLWYILEETLSDEEWAYVAAMDWDEFEAFIYELIAALNETY